MNGKSEHDRQDFCGKNTDTACTWQPESHCREKKCKLKGTLACRWDPNEYRFLMGVVHLTPLLIMTVMLTAVGMATGNWWGMAIFAWFGIMMLLGLETLVLCRHCPYFTNCDKTITCWFMRFFPKWWAYSPRPLNRLEKIVVVWLLFLFPMFVWPVGWAIYGIGHVAIHYRASEPFSPMAMIALCFAVVLAVLQFFLVLWKFYCSRCVNFSCPFNKAPQDAVDAYLELNPVMKEAWIKSGYTPGNNNHLEK